MKSIFYMSKNSIRTVQQKTFNNLFWNFPVLCKLVSLGFFFWQLKVLLMTHWSILSWSFIPLENSFGRSTDILKNCLSPFFIFSKMNNIAKWCRWVGWKLAFLCKSLLATFALWKSKCVCRFDCIWIYS